MRRLLIALLCFYVMLASVAGQNVPQKDVDFPALRKLSLEELRKKTEMHAGVWRLDRIKRWDFNQGSGEIVFTLPDKMKAVAPAQIIGTYNTEDHTWLWSWANPSIDEKLQVDALKLRKFGEEHHIEALTTSKWKGSEEDAWDMAALAVKLCEEQGAYRGPSGSTHVFIAFGTIQLSKE